MIARGLEQSPPLRRVALAVGVAHTREVTVLGVIEERALRDDRATADAAPDQARAPRHEFLNRFSDGATLVLGTHFATPTAGRIVRDGDSYRFEV